ncbi:hypothetical protein [Nucisporomicrobium flavum]|uniref:hypothetical protein n=1 Tax=Nucisporomicrobium flavum TaxID=2785915 RepID=UPI0018F595E7|nr:hypothetical protein [Nucisporomicrobium flavum]
MNLDAGGLRPVHSGLGRPAVPVAGRGVRDAGAGWWAARRTATTVTAREQNLTTSIRSP